MSPEKINASVGILTLNSGKTLRRALQSVSRFDDIVICDGGSTDDTLAIAKEFGARIISQNILYKNTEGKLIDFGSARNQCLDESKHDWFLYIDSDESISEGLSWDIDEVVRSHVGQNNSIVCRVPLGIYIGDRLVTYSSNYPGYQFRFFNKKSGSRFIKTVHERIDFDKKEAEIFTFNHPWYVHTDRDEWNNYLLEGKRYRDITVQKIKSYSQKEFVYFLFFHLRASFAVLLKSIRIYMLHGFKDSMPIRGELGRFLDPLVLIFRGIVVQLRKLFFRD